MPSQPGRNEPQARQRAMTPIAGGPRWTCGARRQLEPVRAPPVDSLPTAMRRRPAAVEGEGPDELGTTLRTTSGECRGLRVRPGVQGAGRAGRDRYRVAAGGDRQAQRD